MSTSEEFDTVTSFGKYSAQSVIEALEIPHENLAACQAVRFIFKVMSDECRTPDLSQTENNRFAAKLAKDKIAKRISDYNLYKNHFFPSGHDIDHDALITAVICDEYIVHANEPIQDPSDPEEVIMRDDGFDADILVRASIIFDGALNYDFFEEETGNICYETAFLVHLNILQSLKDISENIEDFDKNELTAVLSEDLEQFKPLILTWTPFGLGLKDFIDRLETEIQSILTPPPPRGSHLSLVPPSL